MLDQIDGQFSDEQVLSPHFWFENSRSRFVVHRFVVRVPGPSYSWSGYVYRKLKAQIYGTDVK